MVILKSIENKKDLNSLTQELLTNKEIFKFLKRNLKQSEGYLLGITEHFDDINVKTFYGLILDDENKKISQIKFYSYIQTWDGKSDLKKTRYFPRIPSGVPQEKSFSYKDIAQRICEIYQQPDKFKENLRGIKKSLEFF